MNNILSKKIKSWVTCFKCKLKCSDSNLQFFISECCLVIHCEYCTILKEGINICDNCKVCLL